MTFILALVMVLCMSSILILLASVIKDPPNNKKWERPMASAFMLVFSGMFIKMMNDFFHLIFL